MRKPRGRVPDGRVFEIRDIKADTRYLHADYEYVVGDGSLADNDRLLVFELRPKIPGLPAFVARWDGGNRSVPNKIRYDLDIDIREVSDEEIKHFKNGKKGYCGHHTKQIGSENEYIVHLATRAGLVFDATVSFSKHHALLANAPVASDLTVTANEKQATILSKLKAVIIRLYQRARSSVRLLR